MVHETKMSNGENLHGRFEVENIALKAGPKRGFGLGKKFLAVLGAVMFTSLWAVVDEPDCFSYQIKWGGQYLGEDACGYTDEPGCCIHFTDELDEFFGGGYGYADVIVDSYGIGLPYTIYRDDVAIATGVTEYGLNGSMWFTDYDVVPGRTYKYEIKVRGEDVNRILGTDFCIAADSGRLEYTTGPTNVECYFIHTAEIKPTEVAFDKEGGDLDVGVKIYRNTASETIREDRPGYWLNTDSDWIGVRDASQLDWQREFITISADANETGAAREGIVTVGYQGFEWQIKVRQSSAADIAQDPDPVPPDPVTRTVTFNANGGSVSPATCTVEDGASVGELPAATWDGHTLDGWFTAADGGDAVTAETTVTADMTFFPSSPGIWSFL